MGWRRLTDLPPEPSAPRNLADEGARRLRRQALSLDHIAPLATVAEAQSAAGRPSPWPDPLSGGFVAPVLVLNPAAGPRVSEAGGGSGFVSIDNDDRSAALTFELTRAAGLDRGAFVAWNIVPWFHDGSVKVGDLADAKPWIDRFVRALPFLRMVVLAGAVAKGGWERMGLGLPGIEVLACPAISGLGVANAGGKAPIIDVLEQAAVLASEAQGGRRCPRCGATGAEVVYGLAAAPHPDDPPLLYAGCAMEEGNSPRWGCLRCDHRWGPDA